MIDMDHPEKTSVVLRNVTEADLPAFFEHQRDPDANRTAAFPPRDRDAFWAHWTKILADEGLITKTILLDGRVAGNICCFERDDKRQIGYWIGKEFWGRGVATAALAQLLCQVTTRPLYAFVAKHNVGSIRVLEKCGFTVSGFDKAAAPTGGEEVEEVIMKLG
jgi:RimJ/RimL family protein N-acetyltransferase